MAVVRTDAQIDWLERFMRRYPRLFVLTGAGVSTNSGIPAYRDVHGRWQRPPPMQYDQFVGSEAARQRYWARSMLGWGSVAKARPNQAHRTLAAMERLGYVHALVTQNVDGLHQRAGSERVTDLHGCLDRVVCLDCGGWDAREAVQQRLRDTNPEWVSRRAEIAPDGDVLLEADFSSFRVPGCTRCGGMLKPDVVFFGENVPKPRVEAAFQRLAEADALLVAGSSLMVWSGLRFVRAAVAAGKPVVAINRGRTRADDAFDRKFEGCCGELLSAVLAQLD